MTVSFITPTGIRLDILRRIVSGASALPLPVPPRLPRGCSRLPAPCWHGEGSTCTASDASRPEPRSARVRMRASAKKNRGKVLRVASQHSTLVTSGLLARSEPTPRCPSPGNGSSGASFFTGFLERIFAITTPTRQERFGPMLGRGANKTLRFSSAYEMVHRRRMLRVQDAPRSRRGSGHRPLTECGDAERGCAPSEASHSSAARPTSPACACACWALPAPVNGLLQDARSCGSRAVGWAAPLQSCPTCPGEGRERRRRPARDHRPGGGDHRLNKGLTSPRLRPGSSDGYSRPPIRKGSHFAAVA